MSSISGSTLSLTGVATVNGLAVASGSTTLGTVQTGNFSQTGSSTFSTGSGLISLNGTVNTSGAVSVGGSLGVSQVINANGGLNAGSSTIQTTGLVSSGTGTFSGLLTANGGVTSSSSKIEGQTIKATTTLTLPSGTNITSSNDVVDVANSQTISGAKTFSSAITANASSTIKNTTTGSIYTLKLLPYTSTNSAIIFQNDCFASNYNPNTQNGDVGIIFNANGSYTASEALIIAPHMLPSASATASPSLRMTTTETTITGLLTATYGVTTGNSAKITTKCSTATRYGEINTNSDGNTMFNIISEITGNGYFFMYNTSTELLRVNPTEITASKVITANGGVNAGSATIQTTGTLSGGTGTFSGLLTASNGLDVKNTGGSGTINLYLPNSNTIRTQFQTYKTNNSQVDTYLDNTESGASFRFRNNASGTIYDAPIVCGAITSSGLLTANSGVTVPSGQVINANGGLNAGSSTIQTTGLVSSGTGTFSGLFTANAGIKIADTKLLDWGISSNNSCMICLFSGSPATSSSFNYYGFGTDTSILRYQVPYDKNHIFYTNNSTNTATDEILKLNGTGITASKVITANAGLTVPSGKTLTIASGATLSIVGSITSNITFQSPFTTPTAGQLGYTITVNPNNGYTVYNNAWYNLLTISLSPGVWIVSYGYAGLENVAGVTSTTVTKRILAINSANSGNQGYVDAATYPTHFINTPETTITNYFPGISGFYNSYTITITSLKTLYLNYYIQMNQATMYLFHPTIIATRIA